MSKQDRTRARTAAEIEQKYSFGKTFGEVFDLITDAQKAAEEAQKAIDSLDHEKIFNLLTDNGKVQGVYRGDDGDVYINASYIKSGKLAAEFIDADNLTITNSAFVGGTMNVNGNFIVDEDGNLTINGNINLSGGTITWGDNDPSYGGMTSGEVETLITDALVSAPTIAGGRFYDIDQEAYITMESDHAAGHRYAQMHFHQGDSCVFSIYSDNTLSDFDLSAGGSVTVTLNTPSGTLLIAESIYNGEFWQDIIRPQGNWDFSDATVTGL